jgi:hypothetical protein
MTDAPRHLRPRSQHGAALISFLVFVAVVPTAPAQAARRGLQVPPTHVHKPPPSSLWSLLPKGTPPPRGPEPTRVRRRRVLASTDPTAYRAHALRLPVVASPVAAHAASGPTLNVGAGFPGLADNGYYPADAQVAVGPRDIVEMTNTMVAVYTRSGFKLSSFPMSAILGNSNSDDMADPQITWDPTSQRWIAAGMDLTTSETDISVSDTTDPTGGWENYAWSFGTDTCPDQPRLGFSSSVIVVATELFTLNCHHDNGSVETGAIVLVVDKAALLAGTVAPASTEFGPDPTYENFVPVQMLTPSGNELAVSTDLSGSSVVHVLSSQGAPPGASFTEQDSLLIHRLISPPNAAQRGGGIIGGGWQDARVNDATWVNNKLYLVADDRCTYPNDRYLETCARVMEISTAGPQPTLTGENDIGFPNGDTYYAAIRPDTHGNAIILFGYSSLHDWPSVAVTAAIGPIVGEQGGNFISPVILAEGTAPTTSRWGDYSGAAIDPTNPDVIWTAGQVADNFGDTSSGAPYRWATHIDAVSIVDSTLSSLPDEVYGGVIYRGRTRQHQRIKIRPSGGGAHLYNAWATVRMQCRHGGYDVTTFELPHEMRRPISRRGWFSLTAHYGADRYATRYWFSINGRFRDAYSVNGTIRAGERDRKYGRCTSGRVRFSANT